MNIQQSVPGIGTTSAPGLCEINGIPFLAWKGETAADTRVFWSKALSATPNANGQYTWAAQTQVPNVASPDGPALTSFGGHLYLAWVGTDSSLYYSRLVSPFIVTPPITKVTAENATEKAAAPTEHIVIDILTQWAAPVKLPSGSSNGPAMVGTTDALFMAWKGESTSDTRIFWSKSLDGTTWTPQQAITFGAVPAGTTSTPALAAFGTTVYMAWKNAADNSIWWSKCTDGKTWSNQQKITYGTSTGPALTCDSTGVLWLAWKASETAPQNQRIYYSSLISDANNQWGPQVNRYGVGTSNRPALTATGNGSPGVTMAWKGMNTDPNIYYGSLLLPTPNILSFNLPRQNIGQGSISSFAIQAQLVINQNGACTFGGTFFCEDSVFSEDYAIIFVVKDGNGNAYTFTQNGGSGGTQNWNETNTNRAITQNWGGLVVINPAGSMCYWKASDSVGFVDFFEGIANILKESGEDVYNALGWLAKHWPGAGGPEEDPSDPGDDI